MAKTMLWEACIWILLMAVDFTACRGFDFFVFSEQWPPATCVKGQQQGKTCNVSYVPNYWTIHGLWPTSSFGNSPRYCKGPEFNFAEIVDLKEELMRYWPDVYTESSLYVFWKHEWKCHGTCSRNIPDTNNERRYFKKNLELLTKFNITSVLSQHDVRPTKVNPYSPKVIFQILKQYLGHAPSLVCIEDKESKRSLLHEVRICLDLEFRVIDCKKYAINGTLLQNVDEHTQTPASNAQCGDNVYYIPF